MDTRTRPRAIPRALIVVFAGILLVAAGVVSAKQAHAVLGVVHLTISASDPQFGHFPNGSPLVQTATLTAASDPTFATDTARIVISYSVGAMNFQTNGPGWTCTAAAGREDCAGGTLAPGATTTAVVTFVATGLPGSPADVTYTATDAAAFNNATTSTEATLTGIVDNSAAYTKDVPAGAFDTKVGVDQVITEATIDKTYTFTDGPRIITLRVPAEAIPFGAHISVYVANPVYWASSFSSQSKNFVDGYAAAWTWSGATTGIAASSSVTLVVSDTGIQSGDHLYRATTSGIGPSTGIVGGGAWTVSFTEDPGFVAGRVAATTSTSSTASSSGASTAASPGPGLPAAGQADVARQAAMPLVVAGILLVVAGTVAVGLRRRPD